MPLDAAMHIVTIEDIERVPGTTKDWRPTRSGVIEGVFPGSGILWPVKVGEPFQFSNPRILWWAADPNDRRNAFYGLHHDTALKAKDGEGRPLNRRLCAHHAEQATAHLFTRRRRWLYRTAVVAFTHTFATPITAARRFFHGWKKPTPTPRSDTS